MVFASIVVAALFIDFVLLRKKGSHVVGAREAATWSVIWVIVSLIFNGLLWWAVRDTTGSTAIANEKAIHFLTGYLLEKSLAVDNIFVFLMIFSYFSVPQAYQKRVLMYGVLGAIVLRASGDGTFMTDGGHYILDASFGRIPDADALASSLNDIPGVVEHGLFINMASLAIIAGPAGARTLTAKE